MIEDSFKFLEKEKIVKEIRIDSKEVRYDIIEPSLKKFVKDCLDLFKGAIMFRFYITWKGFRPPSPEERLYCELHWGKKLQTSVSDIFIKSYSQTSKIKLTILKKQNIVSNAWIIAYTNI
jgi:hypothetical protein